MDLREADGARVATLDFADAEPVLWIGRDVTLVQLQMEGLRHFAGWSDPALVHFAGPELTAVRSLQCPNCGGQTSKNWSGLLTIIDPAQSELAKTMNISKPGTYALKVR